MPEPTYLLALRWANLHLLIWVLLILNPSPIQGQQLHACKESEYHYEYTECDSTGTRWRVAVPHIPGLCTGLPDPIKGTECSFSCSAGQFLDMEVQKCSPCGEGTYSLGTGVRFDEWTEIPHGFSRTSTNQYGGDDVTNENCSTSLWEPRGEYVASNTDECSSTLMYSINLKQEGFVSFEYLYKDSTIGFEFFVQNDQCQSKEEESKWMKTTENGWSYHQTTVGYQRRKLYPDWLQPFGEPISTTGPVTGRPDSLIHDWTVESYSLVTEELPVARNLLIGDPYSRTAAFFLGGITPSPVLLRNIEITGAAYTSECFPCKPGTFASTNGTSSCQQCPKNTYSNRGANSCLECDPDKYSDAGSASCSSRPPCTDKDYFYTHTPCDSNGETQLMYKWIEPKICSDSMEGAFSLPTSGVKMNCLPCNPGFYLTNSSSCEPCPPDTFSNGTVCIQCPAGTEAILGFEYKWWNVLPSNMKSTVLSGLNFENQDVPGWEVAGDYIYTSAGSSDNDYMILTLNIPSFSTPRTVTQDTESKEVSHITFVFDMKCSMNCQLYFMTAVNSEQSSVVETWKGSREKQSYTYRIQRNANTTFTWAFQRTLLQEMGRKFTADVAKIYSINITNTQDGVASWCQPCAVGTDSLCISCPPGHYIDKKTSSCISCPSNTYLEAHRPYGVESCVQCGPGTQGNEAHSVCFSNCQFSVSAGGRMLQYDFSSLPNVTAFSGSPSFTSKGLKYFHHFSISLCGNQGKKLASCADNAMDARGTERDSWLSVSSYVCQSVIMPSDTIGRKAVLLSQPVSIADRLIGVTTKKKFGNITSPADMFPGENAVIEDILFYYRSDEITESCRSGRTTIVRLRCNPTITGAGKLSLPSKCPDGTCDGCSFHFLWETQEACPLCTDQDYHIITSVCQHGLQKTTPVWREPHICVGGVDLPKPSVSLCKTADFWLKVGVSGGICSALLLTVLTVYFWKKNRSLEYKYSRLMMNAPSKDGELPAADSCAIMEGEDVEDDLIYSNHRSLLRKLISFSGKRTSDGFDSVPLKSSEGTDMDL